jgi:DNA modification methylase
MANSEIIGAGQDTARRAPEGDTVLDNCIGSGTTAVACINTGRNFIGIEKEEKYCRIAEERIHALKSPAQDPEAKKNLPITESPVKPANRTPKKR